MTHLVGAATMVVVLVVSAACTAAGASSLETPKCGRASVYLFNRARPIGASAVVQAADRAFEQDVRAYRSSKRKGHAAPPFKCSRTAPLLARALKSASHEHDQLLYIESWCHMYAGAWDRWRGALRQLIQTCPRSPLRGIALFQLGQHLLNVGKDVRAEQLFKRALTHKLKKEVRRAVRAQLAYVRCVRGN